MNPNDFAAFNEAVKLAQDGQKQESYQKLITLSRATGAKDVNLMLWLAFTTPDLDEAETALGIAESAEPDNPNVVSARLWLKQEKEKGKPVVPVMAAPPPPVFQVTSAPMQNRPTTPLAPNIQPAPASGYAAPGVYTQPVQPYPVYAPPTQVYQVYGARPQPYYQAVPTGRQITGITLFGYYCLYFLGCLALFVLIAMIAYSVTPTEYYSSYYRDYSFKSDTPRAIACAALVVISSVWACSDANTRRAKYGPKAASSPFVVLLVCLFFWFLLFPGYLAQRRRSIAMFGS